MPTSRIPGLVNWSPIGQLPEVYAKGQEHFARQKQRAQEEAFQQALAGGLPRGPAGEVDYGALASLAARHGKIDTALEMSKLGEARRQQDAFTANYGRIMGGEGGTQPVPPPAAARPVGVAPAGAMPSYSGEPPRAKVPSSATVMGDDEAIAAGIYEDPRKVAQAPPQPPVQTQAIRPPVPGQAKVQDRMPGQIPPVPPLPQNPASGRIQQLMALLAAPGARPDQKKGIELALQKELDNTKLDAEEKKYLFYHAQELASGRVPKSVEDWDLARRRATAMMINTAEGQEGAEFKARLGVDVETAKELSKTAAAGARILPLLDQVIKLADKTPGGWSGPVAAQLAKAFSAAGFEVPESLSNAEVLQSISQRLVPIVREPGPTSEKELQVYLNAVPGLMQSQEGRLKVAQMTRDIVDRANKVAQVYRANLGKPDLYAKLAELDKPIFKDRETLQKFTPPVEGARQGADGKWYVDDPNRPGKYLRVTQ